MGKLRVQVLKQVVIQAAIVKVVMNALHLKLPNILVMNAHVSM